VFKSQEAGRASYEGSKIHRLAFDEEPQEDIFDSALVRTIDTRAQVLIAATMWEHGISWMFDRIITPVLEGSRESKFIELVGKDLRMEENPMLDPDEISEHRRRTALRSEEEAAVRFDGKYIPISGQSIFSTQAIDTYMNRAKKEKFEEMEFI